MPKYLAKVSYTTEGTKGVLGAGGSSRRDAVAKLAGSLGGELESFYFAFGTTDAFMVIDMPDNASAAAASMVARAAGGADVEIVVLLSPGELDAASKLSAEYAPPGS